MLVDEVLEDPLGLPGHIAADDLLQIRGQIDANIDIRKDYKIGQLGRGWTSAGKDGIESGEWEDE
jgi:hypothetical protein